MGSQKLQLRIDVSPSASITQGFGGTQVFEDQASLAPRESQACPNVSLSRRFMGLWVVEHGFRLHRRFEQANQFG